MRPYLSTALWSTTRATSRFTRAPLRSYSSPATPQTSPFAPRHLLSIADLTTPELVTLVRDAAAFKNSIKSGADLFGSSRRPLDGKTVAMMFSKRSTRTRVSTEGAIAQLGGNPMFLGAQDIQLGVNESLYDTSVMISSVVSAIVARVHGHEDVAALAKASSVPVINALSDLYHPLQTIADYLTVHNAFPSAKSDTREPGQLLGLEGLNIAWVGDANNVLYDLAIGGMKLGINLSVATPNGYEIPEAMRQIIHQARSDTSTTRPGSLSETNVPEEAVKGADIIVTDTWVSMGQEEEKVQKMKAFEGFQVTADLAKRGGAKEGWQFMHCMPRHPDEVSDEVFYSPKSLVFKEAENRLYSALAVLNAFVVKQGHIL
ncbi:MAG: ornithine carbamoyltransferase [Bogoriella megaspora]|nr:MAG: ornithine carbamoyltransferase [Bogoriella megaspora]